MKVKNIVRTHFELPETLRHLNGDQICKASINRILTVKNHNEIYAEIHVTAILENGKWRGIESWTADVPFSSLEPMKEDEKKDHTKEVLPLGARFIEKKPTAGGPATAPGEIILAFTERRQYVTWFHNLEVGGFTSGHYFYEQAEAQKDFEARS